MPSMTAEVISIAPLSSKMTKSSTGIEIGKDEEIVRSSKIDGLDKHYAEITVRISRGERINDTKIEKASSGDKSERRGLLLKNVFRTSSRRMLLTNDDDNDDISLDLNQASIGSRSNQSATSTTDTFNLSNLSNGSSEMKNSDHKQWSDLNQSNSSVNRNGSANGSSIKSFTHRSHGGSNRKFSNSSNSLARSLHIVGKKSCTDDLVSDIEDDEKDDDSDEFCSDMWETEQMDRTPIAPQHKPSHEQPPHKLERSYRNHTSPRQGRRTCRMSNGLNSSIRSLQGGRSPNTSISKIEKIEKRIRRSGPRTDLLDHKLEGVYSPNTSASKIECLEIHHPGEEEFTNLKGDSIEDKTTNPSPNRHARQSHRRRSNSHEKMPKKSRSRDQPSSRGPRERARSAIDPEIEGLKGSEVEKKRSKSTGRRVKRAHAVNSITSKSKHGIKKLYGTDTDDNTIRAKNTSTKDLSNTKKDAGGDQLLDTSNHSVLSPRDRERGERRRKRIEEVTRGKSNSNRRPRRKNSIKNLSASDRRSSRRLGKEKAKVNAGDSQETEGKPSSFNLKKNNATRNDDLLADEQFHGSMSLIDLLSNDKHHISKRNLSLVDNDNDSLPPPSVASELEFKEKENRRKNSGMKRDDKGMDDNPAQSSFVAEWNGRVDTDATNEVESSQPILSPDFSMKFSRTFEEFEETPPGSFINMASGATIDVDSFNPDESPNDPATGEASKKKKRDGMLKKMRQGLKEGSRATMKKAASTRNVFEQTTIKAFARGKEERKGLLRGHSD